MCGITGYLSTGMARQAMRDDLARSVGAMRHRGPDSLGLWNDDVAGLAHARLSIIDLSEQGSQPMASADGRFMIAFNGEVYNFNDIKEDLKALGHVFRGTSDTEVVLASIAQWGVEKALKRFVGMFAFALWDRAEKKLTLVRDRLGVKPLYYGWDGSTLWFGSELKALRAYSHWTPEIDKTSLAEYFQYGYISAPRSIYTCVRKLEPGHILTVGQSSPPVVKRYWSILDHIDKPIEGSDEEIEEELERLMAEAFNLRMIADVPVGVFLSGGLDSSIVAALLQKTSGRRIHTFTIGFKEKKFDESPWARKVAEHIGTKHTERILDIEDARNIIPKWAELYDEPFGDSSGVPTYLVAKAAREEVKVALSADGGDELFGGYVVYDTTPKRYGAMKATPRLLRYGASAVLKGVPAPMLAQATRLIPGAKDKKIDDKLAKARLLLPEVDPVLFHELTLSYWLPPDIKELIGRHESARQGIGDYKGELVERMMLWDLHNYLPEDILTKVDRATMAVSLEGREPLIDHRLVEFAFRLPLRLRRGPLGPKHLLRKILYKYVPRELVERPKMGFGMPMDDWLRGALSGLVRERLDDKRIRAAGILDPKAVKRTLDAFYGGQGYYSSRVWFLLAFELWRERWMN